MKFKHKLKILRKKMCLSRKALAERADVSVRTIESYEQGSREPTFKTAARLAEVLEVKPMELIRELKKYKLEELSKYYEI